MIEIDGLPKRYGDKIAVDRLSFVVKPGVVTGFLGPNGAGKSTTMRMIAGLDRPTSGTVQVNGKYFPQDARSVRPGLSARSNLLALARTAGIGRRRVDEVIELAGLGEHPGGPGLRRAVVGDPDVAGPHTPGPGPGVTGGAGFSPDPPGCACRAADHAGPAAQRASGGRATATRRRNDRRGEQGAREGDAAQRRRRPGHPGGRIRDDGLRGTMAGPPGTVRGYGPAGQRVHLLADHRELAREVDGPGGSGPPGRLSAAGNQGGEMAAIVIRDNAKATWLTGLAGVRAKACDMIQRAMACAAATILICAVAAALVQLAAELLSFPAPIAVTAMTLMAAALLNSLRRHLRTSARHRSGRGTRIACSDKPASI
jgi:energy-coupling factor transporter ATP-binding protein EcfA2